MATERLYPVGVIAKLLNVSDRRVQQMVKEGIIPKAQRGKYDLIACVQGYVKYLQDLAFGKDMVPTDVHTTRARLQTAQADIAEMEVAQLKERLLDAGKVAGWWAKIIGNAKQNLLAIPSKVAPELLVCKTAAQIKAKLQAMIHEALAGLSEYDPRADTGGASGVGATARPKRKPVGRRKPKTKPRGKRRARKVANG